MNPETLKAEIDDWLFQRALPFWRTNGVDRAHGGFAEALTFEGADAASAFKRTRVACRQVYVFSHAALLGWTEGRSLIDHGCAWLTERAWLGDGFARRTTREGDALDPTPDLYDHAFALFAFAWAYQATRESRWAEWAARTHEVIVTRFHPGAGEGFAHELPPVGWRRQNPHMHLLEACLAAHKATGDARYAETARSVVGLFQTRLFQKSSGMLAEYFDEDWNPAPGDAGRLREPGHHFEWVWILRECRKTFDVDLAQPALALAVAAERFGVDPASGAVRDAVTETGAVISGGSRTWPNTERIKAGVALGECAADGAALSPAIDPAAMIEQSARLLLTRYLRPTGGVSIPAGGWIDAFDADGRPTAKTMPASTFYHLFMALAEARRALGAGN